MFSVASSPTSDCDVVAELNIVAASLPTSRCGNIATSHTPVGSYCFLTQLETTIGLVVDAALSPTLDCGENANLSGTRPSAELYMRPQALATSQSLYDITVVSLRLSCRLFMIRVISTTRLSTNNDGRNHSCDLSLALLPLLLGIRSTNPLNRPLTIDHCRCHGACKPLLVLYRLLVES
jgi:hypothetical protein